MNSSLPFPNSTAISPKWFDHIMQTKKDKWAKQHGQLSIHPLICSFKTACNKKRGGATNVFHLVRQLWKNCGFHTVLKSRHRVYHSLKTMCKQFQSFPIVVLLLGYGTVNVECVHFFQVFRRSSIKLHCMLYPRLWCMCMFQHLSAMWECIFPYVVATSALQYP